MSTLESPSEGQIYRIGAVSRLTGVPPDTLRVWERRYRVVVPSRSPAGTRLYSPEDVGRLGLIKQLVDRGDAISSVANLTLDQLRERIRSAAMPVAGGQPCRPCRLVICGTTLPERIGQAEESPDGLELVGVFRDPEVMASEACALDPDVVVLEYPTVHSEQVREISHLVSRSGAPRAVVVYNFATAATVERMESRRIVPMRAPIDAAELRRWCLTAQGAGQTEPVPSAPGEEVDLGGPLPPRRFDDESLARIAAASPTVRCECPHHLVDLITNLSAFEVYSDECESRNADDAALHAYLHAATAWARSLIETALQRVIEAEGIRYRD